MSNKTDDQIRTVNFYRVPDDTPGKEPEKRLYRAYEGSVMTDIPEMKASLSNLYDLILLHDPEDGCLLLNLDPAAKAKEVVTKLPCKLHQKL